MKKGFILISFLALISFSLRAERTWVEASDLTLIGKIIDTPNPYHRVDTVAFKGFTDGENKQVRCGSGLAIVFKTDSKSITLRQQFGYVNYAENTMGLALHGYDLYIKDARGGWLWAKNAGNPKKDEITLIANMDGSMHECLLYLPLYSELYSLQIGVDEGSVLEAAPAPFRHRVGIFGSSYTQGISCSRPGMTYPAIFTRDTGIQLLSLGCSGNSKLQPYFADVLIAADIEALIIDAFSNPDAKMINERLFPFIERIRAARPNLPIIFLQTIRRENRNFDLASEEKEAAKQAMAAKLMAQAVKKYNDVYFVVPNATDDDHEASVDGVHPSNYGYMLWARSIERPVCRILRKYGIK